MKAPTVDFVGRTRQWGVISAVLLIVSLATLGIKGLDFSIDFAGGNSYQLIDISETVTIAELREAAESAGASEVIVQRQGTGPTGGALVRTATLQVGSPEELAVRQILTEVSEATEVAFDFVGPVWGAQITRQMLQALIVFLLVITLYISFRLEFRMALAALIALAHDLVITIGIYALVGFPVSPATVIALLMVLGYSLYDTVVVFDRVKENSQFLGEPGLRTVPELVNASTNQVLIRSVNTSITSLLPVGALLFLGAPLLGADTLQDLALALFIGIAIGIFSSLFVAGPTYVMMKRGSATPPPRPASSSKPQAPEPDEGVSDLNAVRAPITTEYVRGQRRAPRRRR